MGRKVLWVGDDLAFATSFRRPLGRVGLELVLACDLAEAEAVLAEGETALVVVSLDSAVGPGLSGFQRLKERTLAPLVTLGGGPEATPDLMRAAGAAAHYARPVDGPRLLADIAELARGSHKMGVARVALERKQSAPVLEVVSAHVDELPQGTSPRPVRSPLTRPVAEPSAALDVSAAKTPPPASAGESWMAEPDVAPPPPPKKRRLTRLEVARLAAKKKAAQAPATAAMAPPPPGAPGSDPATRLGQTTSERRRVEAREALDVARVERVSRPDVDEALTQLESEVRLALARGDEDAAVSAVEEPAAAQSVEERAGPPVGQLVAAPVPDRMGEREPESAPAPGPVPESKAEDRKPELAVQPHPEPPIEPPPEPEPAVESSPPGPESGSAAAFPAPAAPEGKSALGEIGLGPLPAVLDDSAPEDPWPGAAPPPPPAPTAFGPANAPISSEPPLAPAARFEPPGRPGASPLDAVVPAAPWVPAPPRSVSAQGALAEHDAAHLLAALARDRVSGTLRVERSGVTRTLRWEAGRIVGAESDAPYERLEEIAFRLGMLGREQYKVARAAGVDRPRRLAVYLADRGFLKPGELYPLVRRRAEEIVFALFEEDAGRWSWTPERGDPEERVVLPAHPFGLVAEGIRRKYTLARVLERLGGPSTLLAPAEPVDYADLGLTARERLLASMVDGLRSLEELVVQSGMDELSAAQALYALLAAGAIKVAVPGLPAATLASRPEEIDHARVKEKLEQVRHSDYFSILGLLRTATRYEVKEAYARLSNEFHPARFASRDLELRREAEEIQRVLADAADVLADDALREAYVRALR